MSQISPPIQLPAPISLPRYRGARGAAAAGLVTMAGIIFIGAVASAVLALLLKDRTPAWQILIRYVWFGIAAGGGNALSWMIAGTQSDRLLKMRSATNKSRGWIGFIGGLMLAGYLTPHLQPAAVDADSKRAKIGQALNIAGPTLDGSRFDLAKYRGKVVLVDFWATWCGPCIAELPNVRSAYDKYHGRGLEVVAVSLDSERTALAEFLETHPEPWPQILFSEERERGFENPLAKQFAVQAIPYLMVVDRDGKLAAHSVRGQQIEVAVTEALGLPVPWHTYLAGRAWRLVEWLFVGVLGSPVWLLLSAGLGCTVIWCLAEAATRRARRPVPNPG